VTYILNIYTHQIVVIALKASENASVKKKACNTDMDKEITGFKYPLDRLALPCARWCWSVGTLLYYVIF
jgi:thiamine pyrophosphokinase